MKLFIALLIGSMGLTASADVGDKYSVAAKTGRGSMDMGMVEIVGMTVFADTDANPGTANVAVKAALDVTTLADMTDITGTFGNVLGGVRDDKMTLQIVYNPADVQPTSMCLGADYEVLDLSTTSDLTDKTCYVVRAKDIIIK